MSLQQLEGPLQGHADDRLARQVARLESRLRNDPDLSFQAAAYVDGRLVLDVVGGPHLTADSLMVPYSSSKVTIGWTVALLVERGELDLDAPVRDLWPEFVGGGKETATVRQLLSHQVGLPEADPQLQWPEMLCHHTAAERMAATTPWWRPGSAFGYHGITIGNLADELVYRVTGRTLHEVYETEIREPLGLDVYLGLPEALDDRRVATLPMVPPLGDYPAPDYMPMRSAVFGPRPGPRVDLANDEASWRFGHPAASATVTARGLAQLMAAMATGVDGSDPVVSAQTVAEVGQQQVRGYDEVLAQEDRAHAIVFQKHSRQLHWGGPRSFGHDGAAGAVACLDPDTGVAFGYTIARGPWPGGADPRAVELAREIGEIAW